MPLLLKKIELFFFKPTYLFSQLKETPDLKRASILFLMEVFAFSLPNIKAFASKYTNIVSALFALIVAMTLMAVVGSIGILWNTFYTLFFCRIFKSHPKFSSLLSGMIYCGIPIIISNILFAFFPFKTDFISVMAVDTYPFLKEVLRSIEPFRLWSAVIEIIAIAVIAGISYLKSFMVVFSFWIIEIILIYSLGLNLGAY